MPFAARGRPAPGQRRRSPPPAAGGPQGAPPRSARRRRAAGQSQQPPRLSLCKGYSSLLLPLPHPRCSLSEWRRLTSRGRRGRRDSLPPCRQATAWGGGCRAWLPAGLARVLSVSTTSGPYSVAISATAAIGAHQHFSLLGSFAVNYFHKNLITVIRVNTLKKRVVVKITVGHAFEHAIEFA